MIYSIRLFKTEDKKEAEKIKELINKDYLYIKRRKLYLFNLSHSEHLKLITFNISESGYMG